MPALSLDQFLGAAHDPEGARYRVLAGLAETKRAFSHNRVYPHLAELIDLHVSLVALGRQFNALRDAMPGELARVDLDAAELVFHRVGDSAVDAIADLISWAVPPVEEAIEEGRTIFEFVDEQLRLEPVGIVPSYVEEGYLVVPDLAAGETHVLRYRLSIVTRADERYRSLRTVDVKTMPYSPLTPPANIKLELTRECPELPNPATYFVENGIDFPFEPTVLPIAKRKLMRHLFRSAA